MADPAQSHVGIVVVSHSALIAEGVVELATQMAPGVRLVAAGGMEDGSIGTDAARIADAIGRADSGAGVLVLADLGSAVMSTELALGMVDPEVAGRTRVSEGLKVAGAVAAAVQANLGSNLQDVLGASEGAITAVGDVGRDARSFEIEVGNPAGLHGRSAANFVTTASGFSASISLENLTLGSPPIDGKSINAVIHSGTERGHKVRISADGEDRDAAIEALLDLANAGFPDMPGRPAPGASPSTSSARVSTPGQLPPGAPASATGPAIVTAARSIPRGAMAGIPGAPGVAIGPVWIYEPSAAAQASPEASALPSGTDEVPAAAEAIRAAANMAADQLAALAERVSEHGRDEDAAIFGTQAMLATDRQLIDKAIARAVAGAHPAAAVESVFENEAADMENARNELLAARGADFRDVGARIARVLRGGSLTLPAVPSVAVAQDLPPSVAEEIPDELLLGIAIQAGSATAHVVILSRGRGIPAVVGVPGLLDSARNARVIAVDGTTGEVALDPDDATRADFTARAEALAERRRAAAALRGKPGMTADGRRVALLANIGSPEDAPRALEAGAEGVGLFRTEFLFMKRPVAPSEEEQAEAYRRVFEAFGPDRPVVVRLADIGGDKALPYLGLPAEANPFLGVRAIRLAYADRTLLATQLRAIWRAAGRAGVAPHVMAPMVGTLADAQLLLELRDEARQAVAESGDPVPDRMVTGVMVEIPSAALIAAELARLVDFFSIGTNDLTQYTLAADRSNPALGRLQDALHPAVLRLVAQTVAGADASRIPVAVCGELAGDPLGALVLVGLGVDELSADANSLDEVRAALATATREQLDELGRRALAAPDAAAVRKLASDLAANSRR